MKQSAYMLLVDDEEDLREVLQETLELAKHHVTTAANTMRAKDAMENAKFDVAVLDIRLPDGSGLELLKSLKESDPDIGVILITGYSEVETAIQAIELGADDFLKKPFEPSELVVRVEELLKKRALKQENKELKKEISSGKSQHGLMGQCDAIKRLRDTALMLGDSDSTVLITGESGTGKEVLANMLHQSGSRADKPFVSINCGAIPEELLESELFGHVKGAFTGAIRARTGRFEAANGGTIFLDEIGDMSPKLQVKLLRVLQERTFEPVGSHQSIHIDVRVVAATHRDLEKEIEEGRFRQDLFYRLNVIPLMLPALQQRGDDVILLTEHFLSSFNKLKNSQINGISDRCKEVMMRYNWPGNVRELRNMAERLVIGLKLQFSHLNTPDLAVGKPYDDAMRGFERDLLQAALVQSGGQKGEAADNLKIPRKRFYLRMCAVGLLEKGQ